MEKKLVSRKLRRMKNSFLANSAFVSNGGTLWVNTNDYNVVWTTQTINEYGIFHQPAPAGCPAMDLQGLFASVLDAEKELENLGYFYDANNSISIEY